MLLAGDSGGDQKPVKYAGLKLGRKSAVNAGPWAVRSMRLIVDPDAGRTSDKNSQRQEKAKRDQIKSIAWGKQKGGKKDTGRIPELRVRKSRGVNKEQLADTFPRCHAPIKSARKTGRTCFSRRRAI